MTVLSNLSAWNFGWFLGDWVKERWYQNNHKLEKWLEISKMVCKDTYAAEKGGITHETNWEGMIYWG